MEIEEDRISNSNDHLELIIQIVFILFTLSIGVFIGVLINSPTPVELNLQTVHCVNETYYCLE